jgi:hypothetical protein
MADGFGHLAMSVGLPEALAIRDDLRVYPQTNKITKGELSMRNGVIWI